MSERVWNDGDAWATGGGVSNHFQVPNWQSGLSVRNVLNRSEWDATVWGHPRGNVFSSWMWGEYKARLGWTVHRIVIVDQAGDVLAFIQCQEKAKGFARFLYVQGGPTLTEKGEKYAEVAMALVLDHLALGRFDLLGIDYKHYETPAGVLALLAHDFAPVLGRWNYTLELDLTKGPELLLQAMDSRWRRQLRRAERHEAFSVRFPTDIDERLACFDAFSAMYGDLKARKGFDTGFNCEAYRDLAAADPHHLFLEICDGGEVVLIVIAHLSPERCTYFITASTEKARGSRAGWLAVWCLVKRAIAEGCRIFDFCGIHPLGDRGLYDFKRGLTKNVVQSGPLWLYSRTRRVRDAAGAYLAFFLPKNLWRV